MEKVTVATADPRTIIGSPEWKKHQAGIFRWEEYRKHQDLVYAGVGGETWLVDHIRFQRHWAGRLEKPILNAACGPDAAHLADFGVINMDIEDPETREPLEARPENFELGDIFHMRYEDRSFKTVILGETLEHCTYESAVMVLKECTRVLAEGGRLVLTFPLDARPNEEQDYFSRLPDDHQEHVYSNGITRRHQTYWDMLSLYRLFDEAGLVDAEKRTVLLYLFTSPVCGFGCVMKKKE